MLGRELGQERGKIPAGGVAPSLRGSDPSGMPEEIVPTGGLYLLVGRGRMR
jgi:hypothetical protein